MVHSGILIERDFMRKLIFLMSVFFVLLSSNSAQAWLYYSKPEFRGRVIDADTKQPLEGAVVVVLYNKWEFGGPGGGNTLPMDARETLTDEKGEFYFPSYKTLIGPSSKEGEATFIIFKPDYKAVTRIEGIPGEKYFAVHKNAVGKNTEIKYMDFFGKTAVWKGAPGIVKLDKAKTREEKWKAPMISTSSLTSSDLPLLYKAIQEAERDLRRGGI